MNIDYTSSEILKKYNQVSNGTIYHIKKTNDNDSEYEKDYMKIRFNTIDDIPLNKVLYLPTITVMIRCIFEKDGKYYPGCYLDEFLYKV